MSKKKRKSGHYCKICFEYKSNESFSGKGHAKHICKRCSKKSPTEQAADITLNRLFNMPFGKLSPAEKSWLENRLHDQCEEKVEELYWGFQDIFAPAYSEEEECEKDMELQTGIDDLPF